MSNLNPVCPVCRKAKLSIEMQSGETIRPVLLETIHILNPHWTTNDKICMDCLNTVRSNFVEKNLIQEKGSLNQAEIDVIEAIRNHEVISIDTFNSNEKLTFGERLSDRFAEVGGSWHFIIFFTFVLFIWIIINTIVLSNRGFDPYPFILLNLVLSCIAALQAPIIMMSQNRQESKDRARAEADYKTNLKAELEIRHLHLKLDQLVTHQWHQLLEIQQIQLDMLKDLKK